MIREATFAGKVQEKDEDDIFYWAFEKTHEERLEESWRLHCMNHGVSTQHRLDRTKASAKKRH